MTLRNLPVTDDERLSSDEIDSLRLRLSSNGKIDERIDGALTIADLAEACGVKTSDVIDQLRQIRAERAFGATVAKPKSQTGMLFLAIAMFSVAALIFSLRPHRPMTDEEREQAVTKLLARPKRIHYPVEKRIDLGDANPPSGFELELAGPYTIVTTRPSQNSRLMAADQAERQLARSLEAIAIAAEKFAGDTPAPPEGTQLLPPGIRPSDPKPNNQLLQSQPGLDTSPLRPNEFQFKSANFSPNPLGRIFGPPTDSAGLANWRSLLADRAKAAVKAKVDQQRWELHPPVSPVVDRFPMPPVGFRFMFAGKNPTTKMGQTLRVLPIEKEVTIERLDKVIRDAIRSDREPLPGIETPAMKTEMLKKPIPPFSKVEIIGPNETSLSIQIPTERSPQFPTAADVVRGQEAAIADFHRKIGRLIDRINSGAGK